MRRRLLFAAPLLLALAGCQNGQVPNLFGPSRAHTFPIFFTEDSALLGANAQGIITMAADAAKADANARVVVRGFAAPDTGTAAFNRALSEARARAVADALISKGIPTSRVAIQPRGEVSFEMFPTESRRVEIHIGG